MSHRHAIPRALCSVLYLVANCLSDADCALDADWCLQSDGMADSRPQGRAVEAGGAAVPSLMSTGTTTAATAGLREPMASAGTGGCVKNGWINYPRRPTCPHVPCRFVCPASLSHRVGTWPCLHPLLSPMRPVHVPALSITRSWSLGHQSRSCTPSPFSSRYNDFDITRCPSLRLSQLHVTPSARHVACSTLCPFWLDADSCLQPDVRPIHVLSSGVELPGDQKCRRALPTGARRHALLGRDHAERRSDAVVAAPN